MLLSCPLLLSQAMELALMTLGDGYAQEQMCAGALDGFPALGLLNPWLLYSREGQQGGWRHIVVFPGRPPMGPEVSAQAQP